VTDQDLAVRSVDANLYVLRVGGRIARNREMRGLSQRDLARIVGCSQRTIGLWEDGSCMPRVDAQISLADAFGVQPDNLFSFARRRGER
jgi:transcriptional regulator with XRE-family HTH domain